MSLQRLIEDHGAVAIFLGAALEGDLSLVLAGVVAHLGFFDLPLAILCGIGGSFTSDCLWYALGRWRGPHFRAGAIYRRFGPQVEKLARRLGPWQLLTARFVYGTKNATMVFWGLHGLDLRRFLPIEWSTCSSPASWPASSSSSSSSTSSAAAASFRPRWIPVPTASRSLPPASAPASFPAWMPTGC